MRAHERFTARQRRFVEEYLIDLNATQAAIRAGYSTKTAQVIGAQNLTKPMVAEAIQRAVAKRSQRTGITSDRVVAELGRIAFSDMREFATWGAGGVRLKSSEALLEDAARCVAELSQTVTQHGGTIRFKLHDKVAALAKLAEHLGMFGADAGADFSDIAKLTDEELDQYRKKLRLVP